MTAIRFTQDHLWMRADDDGVVTVGITDYGQHRLGDVVAVETPKPGVCRRAGEDIAVVEALELASDIKLPFGGTIAERNERLTDAPELLNSAPETEAWLFRIRPEHGTEPQGMDPDAYEAFVSALER